MPETPIHLLLVEDDPRCAGPLHAALARHPSIHVALAPTLATARALAAAPAPLDVVLLDLGLPDGSGLDFLRALTDARPEVVCLVLTVFDDRETVLSAVAAGARGYLLKGGPPDDVVARVQEAARGACPMAPEAVAYLLDALRPRPAPALATLTRRERDIATLLAEGHTYEATARALGIRTGTVQTHVKSIYGKLGVGNRQGLAHLVHPRVLA